MFKKKPYLCLVIDRETKAEIAEYKIDSFDEYSARSIAASKFELAQKYQPSLRRHTNWCIDACGI